MVLSKRASPKESYMLQPWLRMVQLQVVSARLETSLKPTLDASPSPSPKTKTKTKTTMTTAWARKRGRKETWREPVVIPKNIKSSKVYTDGREKDIEQRVSCRCPSIIVRCCLTTSIHLKSKLPVERKGSRNEHLDNIPHPSRGATLRHRFISIMYCLRSLGGIREIGSRALLRRGQDRGQWPEGHRGWLIRLVGRRFRLVVC